LQQQSWSWFCWLWENIKSLWCSIIFFGMVDSCSYVFIILVYIYVVNTFSFNVASGCEVCERRLGEGEKNYVLTNGQSQYWNCKIWWTGRSSFKCYLTCGWKKYCKENGLVASDRIRFIVQADETNVIQILKI